MKLKLTKQLALSISGVIYIGIWVLLGFFILACKLFLAGSLFVIIIIPMSVVFGYLMYHVISESALE